VEIIDFCVRLKKLTDRVTLMPVGCVHYDHPNCDRDLFRRFLDMAESTKNCYVIGMGDLRDLARTTYRDYLSSWKKDDSQENLDRLVRKDMEEFAKMWYPLSRKKAVIGLLEGNHFFRFSDGTTDTQYLCQLLECKYMGKSAFIRLYVSAENTSTTRTLVILAHHGYGSGGRYISTDVGQMERNVEPAFEADIYLSSHTHKRFVVNIPTLGVNRRGKGKIIEKPKLLAKTGAFLRGYCTGVSSYAEDKLLRPTDLGWVTIYVQLRTKSYGDKQDDVGFRFSHEY